MTNEIKEAVKNFKDYTSGHGYVLRNLAEQVLAVNGLPEEYRKTYAGIGGDLNICEYCNHPYERCNCHKVYNLALNKCRLAIAKDYVHKSKLLDKNQIAKVLKETKEKHNYTDDSWEEFQADAIIKAQTEKQNNERN